MFELLSKLVWFTKFRVLVKGNALAVFGGGAVWAVLDVLQTQKLIDLSSFADKLYPVICSYEKTVCATFYGDETQVLFTVIAVLATGGLMALYKALSPKFPFLVSAEQKAESLLNDVPAVDPTFPKDKSVTETPSVQSWKQP
jgi:hypothetical protein